MVATHLVPMGASSYEAYVDAAVARYAEDNVASGRWPRAVASERSRAAYAAILPKGLQTPDTHLLEIKDEESHQTIGSLLFAVVGRDGERSAFVYDLHVLPQFRRRGYATSAFEALETIVRDLGLSKIGLHVFAHNAEAQALYAKLGYAATGINMRKCIGTAKS